MAFDNPLGDIANLEKDLWEAADQLRANSKLTSSEYCMPVLGVIFLRHAANRFETATRQIEKDRDEGRIPRRPLVQADYVKRHALMLPEVARYDYILGLPKDRNLGDALIAAMNAIEESFGPLQGVLPKEYGGFDRDLLEDLLRIFNREALKTAGGDVFGRIYEYFLMEFAIQGAQDNGEFFTPPSIVQMIVNVIEPGVGQPFNPAAGTIVLDPASGSGGMFVQSSHFMERMGMDAAHKLTFYGQEKTGTTIRLAKMNLAVHGLEGDIREANTFYEDVHTLHGKCDRVMANPPFNVDMVDAEKVKDDVRLPFGLPGVNKAKKVSNGNYLWISFFWSYLNPKGRAGFVMSSQASSGGHGEKDVRRKIVETGDVDAMVAIRSNFFYTRTVPCELWFIDKGKPSAPSRSSSLPSPSGRGAGGEHQAAPLRRKGSVLMLDARNVYRKVTRKIYDFSPAQLANLTAIMWLYRGEERRFALLAHEYYSEAMRGIAQAHHAHVFWNGDDGDGDSVRQILEGLRAFTCEESLEKVVRESEGATQSLEALRGIVKDADDRRVALQREARGLFGIIEEAREAVYGIDAKDDDPEAIVHRLARESEALAPLEARIAAFRSEAELFCKGVRQGADIAEKSLGARRSDVWRKRHKMQERLEGLFGAQEALRTSHELLHDSMRNLRWLLHRFPDGRYADVPGLCRVVSQEDIAAADWSLTPGRYVGVAPAEADEDFDFGHAMRDIHVELASLNEEAVDLAKRIQENFEGLAV